MLNTFWPILVFVPFFLLLFLLGTRRRPCPTCGVRLSGFQSPLTKTRRQWVEGGYLCQQCGCESDLTVTPVAPDTGYSRGTLFKGIALMGAAGIPAIVLIVLLLWRNASPRHRKEPLMSASKKNVLVVNVLFWVVAALLHPLAGLLPPAANGEPMKIYSLLIPILLLLLAFGSTAMVARALAAPGAAADRGRM